jgi:protein tyrosine/serine phosphatase
VRYATETILALISDYSKGVRKAASRFGKWGRGAVQTYAPSWMKRALGPFARHLDMLFIDHGIFRVMYLNYHRIDDHAARCAQPTPGQIRRFAKGGIKTIVNLRGERDCSSYVLEKRACEEAGIKLVNFQARSRAAPRPSDVRAAVELFAEVEYPIVMHCKSGADRAGIMSVLYLFLHRGVPLEEAIKQLSFKYGHIRQAQTGVLDHFFESYLKAKAETGIEFWTWLDTVYDADAMKAEYRSTKMADRVVDLVLRRE